MALYGEVDGSYMDGMLPLMIGEKDDTNRKWGCGPREEWHLCSHSLYQHAVRCVQSRSTDLVALFGEVDGSYMDEMLLLMIGGKDDTNRTWGGGPREEWHLCESHSATCSTFRAKAVCVAL